MSNRDLGDNILAHPLTMEIYLYFRRQDPEPVGVREAQRYVDIRSASTVKWHFDKLSDAGIIEQNSDRKYHLTAKGYAADLEVPIKVSARLMMGRLVPRFSILLGMSVFGVVVQIILFSLRVESEIIALSTFLNLLIMAGIVLYEWYTFQDRFRKSLEN